MGAHLEKATLGGSRTPAPCLEGKDDNRFTTSVLSICSASGTQPKTLTPMRKADMRARSDHMQSTMSLLFNAERQVAITAVRRACGLTTAVFNELVKGETLTKGDKSPVTGKSLSADLCHPTDSTVV